LTIWRLRTIWQPVPAPVVSHPKAMSLPPRHRLMRDEGMRGLVRGRKNRTTIAGKDGVRAGDLLNRQFRTTAPNRAWVTDFTYVPTPDCQGAGATTLR